MSGHSLIALLIVALVMMKEVSTPSTEIYSRQVDSPPADKNT